MISGFRVDLTQEEISTTNAFMDSHSLAIRSATVMYIHRLSIIEQIYPHSSHCYRIVLYPLDTEVQLSGNTP